MVLSVKNLLLEKFLQWQSDTREIKTQKEFADYIRLSEASLNHVMSGRRPPSRKIVEHLVLFFNDPGFYDAAEIPRPDPRLYYITRNWGNTPVEIQKKIAEVVQEYTTEKAPNDDPAPDAGTMETDP
jgi:hypothetical protein